MRITLHLVALVALQTAAAGDVQAVCPGNDPAVVLECLGRAYAERDSAAYDSLLAEDFTFRFTPEAVWSRTQDLAGTGKLFHDDDVESLSMEFTSPQPAETGAEPGLWWLSGVTTTLTVNLKSKPEPLVIEGTMNLLVRGVPGDPSGYEIVTWEDPSGPENEPEDAGEPDDGGN